MSTTVFVGANGGGGFIGQFLPYGASAMFYDAWRKGKSVRFGGGDGQMWSNMPHIRSFWYTLENETEIIEKPPPVFFMQTIDLDCPLLVKLTAHAIVAASHSLGLPAPSAALGVLKGT